MKHKSLFIIFFAVLVIILLAVWINIHTKGVNAPQPKQAREITDPDTKTISADSVILGTDNEIYSPGDNITAYVLVKNEFSSERAWELIAGIKDPGDSSGARFVAFQSKEIKLSPGEISRQDIVINTPSKKLALGKYDLILSIRENNQEISLKAITFEVR